MAWKLPTDLKKAVKKSRKENPSEKPLLMQRRKQSEVLLADLRERRRGLNTVPASVQPSELWFLGQVPPSGLRLARELALWPAE